MSVHYKFKSTLEYDTVTFDGLHISVKDLKNAIVQQKRIGKNTDFDLQVTNAQTKEVYDDEEALIPKNTSLLIARIPVIPSSKSKNWEGYGNDATPIIRNDEGGAIAKAVDLSSLDASEDDKIRAMISQSTQDYDPSNYMKIRGANQVGTVPTNYRCYKCHQQGHWIKDCPLSQGPDPVEIKKSTGIPRSFMVPVEGPQVQGAMMTPNGSYAVPALDHQTYTQKQQPAPAAVPDEQPDIPEDLICSICQGLLADAVMIPCCGNSFCDECIRGSLLESEDHECPDCHERDISPVTLIPNRYLRNSVANFKSTTGYIRKPPAGFASRQKATVEKSEIVEETKLEEANEGDDREKEVKEEKREVQESAGDTSEKTIISEADSTEPKIPKAEDAKPDVAPEGAAAGDESSSSTTTKVEGPPGVSPRRDRSPRRALARRPAHDNGASRDASPARPPPNHHHHQHHHQHQQQQHQHRQRPAAEERAGTPTVDEPGGSSSMISNSAAGGGGGSYSTNSGSGSGAGGYPGPPPGVLAAPMVGVPPHHAPGPPPPPGYQQQQAQPPPGLYASQGPPPPNYRLPPPGASPAGPYMGPYNPPPRPIFDHHTRPPMQGPPPSYGSYPPRSRTSRDYGMSRTRTRTPPGIIDDPLEAFNRMLREKDERERRAKQRKGRSYSRSPSRSYSRSPKRGRSRSPRRRSSRSRSRSFSISRSRSRSFSPSPRNASPYREYSPPPRNVASPRCRRPASRYRSPPVRSPQRYRYKEPAIERPRERDYDRHHHQPPPPSHHQQHQHPQHQQHRSSERSRGYSRERDYASAAAAAYHYERERGGGGGGASARWAAGPAHRAHHPAAAPPAPPDGYYPSAAEMHAAAMQQHAPPPGAPNRYPPRDYPPAYKPEPVVIAHHIPPPMISQPPAHHLPPPVPVSRRYEDIAPPGTELPPIPGEEIPPRYDDRYGNYGTQEPPQTAASLDREDKSEKRRVIATEDKRIEEDKRKYEAYNRSPPRRKETSSERKLKEHESPDKHRRRRHESQEKEREKEKREEKVKEKKEISDDERSKRSKDKKKKRDKKEMEKKKRKDKKEKHEKKKDEKEQKKKDKDEKIETTNVVVEQTRVLEKEKLLALPIKKPHAEIPDQKSSDSPKTNLDLYDDFLRQGVDTKVIESYVKTDSENPSKTPEIKRPEEIEISKDEDVLDIHANELELKSELEREMLAPVPEKSKWEIDDDPCGSESKLESKGDRLGKVTNEVLKRAENAIFAKAINAIRPIEIKKISVDRAKLYSDQKKPDESPKPTQNPIVSFEEDFQQNVASDILKTDSTETQKPQRLSVKERLGVKVDDIERIVKVSYDRNRSRSLSPLSKRAARDLSREDQIHLNRHLELDRRSDSRSRYERDRHSRNYSRQEQEERRRPAHPKKEETKRKRSRSRSASRKKKDKKQKREKSHRKHKKPDRGEETVSAKNSKEELKLKPTATEKRKPTLDEANFEPDYDLETESEKDEPPMTKTSEKISEKPKAEAVVSVASVKKDSSSSDSSESSSEEERRSKRKHRKRKKKRSRKDSTSSSSSSESESSDDGERERRRKKSKKKQKKRKKSKHK